MLPRYGSQTAGGLVDQGQDLLAKGSKGPKAGNGDRSYDHSFLSEHVTPAIF